MLHMQYFPHIYIYISHTVAYRVIGFHDSFIRDRIYDLLFFFVFFFFSFCIMFTNKKTCEYTHYTYDFDDMCIHICRGVHVLCGMFTMVTHNSK